MRGLRDALERLWVRLHRLCGWPSQTVGRDNAYFGRLGERRAARHLKKAGYRILARNFRAAGAEIDLIALDGDTIVFVEVKSRRSDAAGAPEEAVDERKQERIRRAAEIFASSHRLNGRSMRFDVVALRGQGAEQQIKLLKGAF
jgi:putative endonuclease